MPPKKRVYNRRPPATPKAPEMIIPHEIRNEAAHMVSNGLSEAIMGFNPGSIGVELSQVDSLFKNNRWYLISNMRQLLSEIYVEQGPIKTVIDVPVDDGMRGGVTIKTKFLEPDEIEQIQADIQRQNIITGVVGQALKWDRLYGGAGVLIISDQPPELPFDIEAVKEDTPIEFRAVDMWELFWDKQNTEGYNPELQMQEFEFYRYYAHKTHKSRVMAMKGLVAPSFIRPRLRGWGLSVCEILVRSVNQYLKANNLSYEVLDEFKIDIYKIKNLTQTLLAPGGTDIVQKRVQLANMQKNFQNAITMDGEDDYMQKQLSFAGIAETMKEIRMQLASDLRMPMSKIFGISASGFSSGEDDIENYNCMVESSVREKSKFILLRIIEIMCKKKFGIVPDDLQIEFTPLRMLSSEQEENVKTQQFSRIMQARAAGEISVKEFRDACNKEQLLGIHLDLDDGAMSELEEDLAPEGDGQPTKDKKESPLQAPGPQVKAPKAPASTVDKAPQPKNALKRFLGVK